MEKCKPETLLKKRKLKQTRQRLFLLQTIIDSGTVFSAVSLQDKTDGKMDLVTVYRILALFVQHGIIREIVSNDTTRFFELACVHHPVHPHFVCKCCNRIICLEKLDPDYMKRLSEIAGDNLVEEISVQLSGICSDCIRRTEQNT